MELQDIQIPKVCPVLGIPIELKTGIGRYDSAPSLDRIVPEKGYIKGNVIVISWRANDIRADATTQEMQKIVDFYKKYD